MNHNEIIKLTFSSPPMQLISLWGEQCLGYNYSCTRQKCTSLQMPSLTIPMPQDRSVLQPTGCDDQELLHNISSRGSHINSCRPNQKIVVHHTKQLPLSENLLESLRQIKNNIPYSYIHSLRKWLEK